MVLCIAIAASWTRAQVELPGKSVATSQATLPATSPATQPVRPADNVSEVVLTTTESIRQLSNAAAASRLPVKLRGTVTAILNQPSILFIQDDTGGICVFGLRGPAIRRQLRPGAVIEVEGVTQPGRVTPYVTSRNREALPIAVVSDALRVPSGTKATLAELRAGRRHGELVEVGGVVRAIRADNIAAGSQAEGVVLALADGDSRVEAILLTPGVAGGVPSIGATVRLRGVFNSSYPDRTAADKSPVERPSAVVNRLIVAAARDVQVIRSAPSIDSLPTTPVAEMDGLVDPANPRRLKLAGVVTLALPGKGFYLQDGQSGVWIDSPALTAEQAKPGDHMQVIGFTRRGAGGSASSVEGGGAPVLEDAVLIPSTGGALPDPLRLTAEQALSGDFHARLVALDAVVLEVSRLSEGPTLVLQAGERVFLARLPADGPDVTPTKATENSWVRVAGVCVNNRLPSDTGSRPVSFHLMLANTGSITVIRAPGWWTLEKALATTALVLLVALLAFAWVVALRRRVARQTEQLRRHVHQETVHEERMRIARELHDSLEQDLLGITMQLKATEKVLDRPEKAKDALTLANAMVRRTQAETHRAVWDLRERKPGQEGLVPTLRQAVAGLTVNATADAPAVHVQVEGAECELPPQTENHLLRVALEAVTNAFKHARARNVTVSVRYSDQSVELSVRDDGKGFDADHPPDPISGHFGLFGMKERAAKLHAKLDVTSKPGEGSEIRLQAPIAAGSNGSA